MKKTFIILGLLLLLIIPISSAYTYFSSQKNVDDFSIIPAPYIEDVPYNTTVYIGDVEKIDFAQYLSSDYHDINFRVLNFDFDNPKIGEYKVIYEMKNNIDKTVYARLKILVWNFTKFSNGSDFVLGLNSLGEVYAWGGNFYGELGFETNGDCSIPTKIPTLENIIDISACNTASFALNNLGEIYSWGTSPNGALGRNTNVSYLPELIDNPDNLVFTSLAGGGDNTIGAFTDSGDLYAWGYGEHGALGNGSNTSSNVNPLKIETGTKIISAEFATFGGLLLDEYGDVYAFGRNNKGQLTKWDFDIDRALPAKITKFNDALVKISADQNVRFALTNTGTVYAWGENTSNHTGLNMSGSSVTWYPTSISNNAKDVASSTYNGIVLQNDGTLITFGDNGFGQLGNFNDDDTPSNFLFDPGFHVEKVFSLFSTTLMFSNNQMYGIGHGGYGELGNGDITETQNQEVSQWILQTENVPFLTNE